MVASSSHRSCTGLSAFPVGPDSGASPRVCTCQQQMCRWYQPTRPGTTRSVAWINSSLLQRSPTRSVHNVSSLSTSRSESARSGQGITASGTGQLPHHRMTAPAGRPCCSGPPGCQYANQLAVTAHAPSRAQPADGNRCMYDVHITRCACVFLT
jgi:hypothetical protein